MDSTDICSLLLGVPLDRVVVFDTETTGLRPGLDELLQVSIVDAFGNRLMDSLVRPTRRKSWPDAERIHGISPRDVRRAPTIDRLAPQIREILGGDRLLVAYNMKFDMGFLRAAGIFGSEWSPDQTFDVMLEYSRVRGASSWSDSGRYRYSKLTDCAKFYGYSFSAHDSLEDARATAWCFRSLLCDPEYLSLVTEPYPSARQISATQSKSTREAASDLLRGQTTSLTGSGELTLGEFASGKSKGMSRYFVQLNGREVGACTARATEKVRKFMQLGPEDDLPGSVACEVALSKADSGSIRCSVTITEGSPLAKKAAELAERDRPSPDEAKELDPGAAEVNVVSEAEPAAHATAPRNEGSPRAGRNLTIVRKLALWAFGISLAVLAVFAFMCVPFGGGIGFLVTGVILAWVAMKLTGRARRG
ncbi:MAG: 3'-5' exonuclease [Olsenella sp.]|jgi:DNA polymerase III epsilon subunit-like protein|nr:3'-5' exonuclease [Olsenella sp.]